MKLYKEPVEVENKTPVEETRSCNMCDKEVEGGDFALYEHKLENHSKPNLIKCAKCGIETNNQLSWLALHECPLDIKINETCQKYGSKGSETKISKKAEGMTLTEMNEMIM